MKEAPYLTVTRGGDAHRWLAAALYATQLGNTTARMPNFDELPQRLKDKWLEDAYSWFQTLAPLLRPGIVVP